MSSPAAPLTEAEASAFAAALSTCEAIARLRAEGLTYRPIARQLGLSLRATHAAHADHQAYLADPARDPRLLLKGRSTGRPPLARLEDFPEALAALRALAVGSNRATDAGSMAMAIWKFVNSADCPEPLRAALVRPGRGPGDVSAYVRARLHSGALVHRFHRNSGAATRTIAARMNRIVREADGTERPLIAGELLTPDDLSVNFHFWIADPSGTTECSRRWGCRVGRFQLLAIADVASLFIPSFQFVLRERESYTSDDVAAFLYAHMQTHGVPDRLLLEGGAWQGEAVQGLALTPEARLGGLRQLGVELSRAWDSNDKTWIEARFNPLHTLLTEIPGQIGRSRGEMREVTLLVNRLQRGAADPRLHLWDKARAVAAVQRAVELLNLKPVDTRDGRWIPAAKWAASPRVITPRPVPADSAWLLARERREWTVVGDTVRGKLHGGEGSVAVEYRSRHLPALHGQKVAVFADGYLPGEPATIVYAGVAPLCVEGRTIRPGEVICRAVPEVGQPVIDHSRQRPPAEEAARQERLASRRNVAREYRALGLDHGKNARAISESDNGKGNVTRIESGAPARSAPCEALAKQGRVDHASAAPSPAKLQRSRAAIFEDLDAPSFAEATEGTARFNRTPTAHRAPCEASAKQGIHYEDI